MLDDENYGEKVNMFVGVTVDIDWSLKVSALCVWQWWLQKVLLEIERRGGGPAHTIPHSSNNNASGLGFHPSEKIQENKRVFKRGQVKT